MRFLKLKFLVAGLAVTLALIGCNPTPETIGNIAKTSIQEILRVDPRFEGTGIEVVKVQLRVDSGQQYTGIASIKYKEVVHDIPVTVLVDGLSIKWSTTPDAFSFVPQTKPPQ